MKFLLAWSATLGSLAVAAAFLPRGVGSAAAHDSTPGAALGYVGILFVVLTVAFLAPLVLGAIWLAGYVAWRGSKGAITTWSIPKVLLWLGLAVLAAEVLTLTATSAVLPGFQP